MENIKKTVDLGPGKSCLEIGPGTGQASDFETYDFCDKKSDLIYSAATIQWIKEDVAYSRVYDLLKEGGILAMCFMHSEYETSTPALFADIQKIYDKYFVSEQHYSQKFDYANGESYGLKFIEKKAFPGKREYNADEHREYIGTHSDHITLKEEYRK